MGPADTQSVRPFAARRLRALHPGTLILSSCFHEHCSSPAPSRPLPAQRSRRRCSVQTDRHHASSRRLHEPAGDRAEQRAYPVRSAMGVACGAAPGRMLLIRCAHSQVPFHCWTVSKRYATYALALRCSGSERCNPVVLFYMVGQVVRSGTSHKAPYATWFFYKELPAAH